MKKQLTLCFIHEPERILLGMKKRGFGAGRWNGFGGKLNPDETLIGAAIRELREESGVHALQLDKRGVLEFIFDKSPDEILEVHVFSVSHFTGEPIETEEMLPQWFAHDEIPFATMWPDDIHWFPLFLEGKQFRGRFVFGDNDAILELNLEEVEKLGE